MTHPFLPALPSCWPALHAPAVAALDALLTGTLTLRDLREQGRLDTDEAHDLLRRVGEAHDALMAHAAARFAAGEPMDVASEGMTPPPPVEVTPEEAQAAFAEAALRMLHLRRTVLHQRPLLDTIGSRTLHAWRSDLCAETPEQIARWRGAVAQVTGADLEALERGQLRLELEALERRHRLMDALDDARGLRGGGRAQALALLDELFPGHGLRSGEVDVVVTATSVFFCLPFDVAALASARGEPLEPDTAGFIERLSKMEQRGMLRFPAFSPVEGERIADSLIDALAALTGEPGSWLRAMLTTMVTVLPREELDKYIVHDVWGHHWQAHLFTFEETYRRAAHHDDPPPLDPAAAKALPRALEGDRGALEAWFYGTLAQRLLDCLTALLAEVLADAMEQKLLVLAPKLRADMPSSSFFQHLPTKLDLTLADLPIYFRFATRGLARLARDPGQEPTWRAALARSDAPDPAAALAAQLQALLDDPRWASRFEASALDGDVDTLGVNAFTRVGLGFLGMQEAFNALSARLDARPPQPPGALIERHHELLVFTAAAFFEQDPARNFWRLGRLLRERFEPLWDALLAQLDA